MRFLPATKAAASRSKTTPSRLSTRSKSPRIRASDLPSDIKVRAWKRETAASAPRRARSGLPSELRTMFAKASGRKCRSRRPAAAFKPIACRPLRGGDYALRHLVGDFAAQPDRFAVALHRRKVEPLVRGDQINRHVAADRVHHAELEQHVACGRSLAERRRCAIENLKTCHRTIPCPYPVAIPLSRSLPALCGRLIFRIIVRTFEW